ncbi:MAG TPA: helix-turn-helix transcriptional regulator [Candidatus Omnitrophota bacterium]|nr:helix-turn-helix transcriptional regulator [Candidatus Omnitrophota bacterium]
MQNRIREIRQDRGLSQEQLADKVGTTKAQISKLEKSQRRLTDQWMRRLAVALECHPGELFADTPVGITPEEQAILDLYRGLSEPDKQAAYRVVDAMAKSHEPNSDSHNGGKKAGNGG